MGHPHVIGTLTELFATNQGQTFTIDQICAKTHLTPPQVLGAMRTLVIKTDGRVAVVVRAKAWRMATDAELARKAVDAIKDAVSATEPPAAPPAAQKQSPGAQDRPTLVRAGETPQKAATDTLLLLELLGHSADGSEIGRDDTGQLWKVNRL